MEEINGAQTPKTKPIGKIIGNTPEIIGVQISMHILI